MPLSTVSASTMSSSTTGASTTGASTMGASTMGASIRRLLAALLMISIGALPMSGPASAAMVPTTAASSPAHANADFARTRLAAALARPDLSAQLEALGLTPDEAARRVAALDDATAIDAADRLDHMPAGGGLLGIAVFVFAVRILPEVIGLTRIFPFTRR